MYQFNINCTLIELDDNHYLIRIHVYLNNFAQW